MSGSGWWEAFRSLSVSPAALRLGLPATHDAPGQASSADGRTGRVGKPLVGSLGGPNEKKKKKEKMGHAREENAASHKALLHGFARQGPTTQREEKIRGSQQSK